MELELKSGMFAGIPYESASTNLSGKDLAFVGGAVFLMRGLALAGEIGMSLASSLLGLCKIQAAPVDMPPIPLSQWLTQVEYKESTFYGFVLSQSITGQIGKNNINIPMNRVVRISDYSGWTMATNVQTIEGSLFGKITGPSKLQFLTVAGPLEVTLPTVNLKARAAAIPQLEEMRKRFEESLNYKMDEITRILGEEFLAKYFNIHTIKPEDAQ